MMPVYVFYINLLSDKCKKYLDSTAGPPPKYDAGSRYTIATVLVLITSLCIAGNIIVIVAVATRRHLWNITYALMVSRAVADLGVGILVMPFQVYIQSNNKDWFFGETFCLVTTSFDVMLCTVSIFHLASIILERYIAICKPKLYQYITLQHVLFALGICWVIPTFISFLPIMNKWNNIGIEDMLECILPPSNVCAFYVNVGFAWICSIIAWYIPAAVMLYGFKIYWSLNNRSKSSGEHTVHEEKQAELAKTFLVAVLLAYVCWFSFFIPNLIDPLIGYKIPHSLWIIVLWLGYINCAMHPFLYYAMILDFRVSVNRMLKCKGSRPNHKVNPKN